MKRSSLPFRNIVALIGAFCISFNLTSITHELGHALAVRLGGGVAERITLNSFSFSYTRYADVGRDRAFAAAGGALFGSLAGLTAWLFTRRSRSALALPLRLCGMLACSVNGLYWLTDPLLNMKGDASTLLRLGWPPWVIVTVGGGLLLVGLLLGIQTLPALGVHPTASFVRRLGILWGGTLPYLGMVAVYNTLHPAPPGPLAWALVALGGAFAVLIWALLSWAVQVVFRWPGDAAAEVSWPSALRLLATGALVFLLIQAFPIWRFQ